MKGVFLLAAGLVSFGHLVPADMVPGSINQMVINTTLPQPHHLREKTWCGIKKKREHVKEWKEKRYKNVIDGKKDKG